jgi:hypothetical protein
MKFNKGIRYIQALIMIYSITSCYPIQEDLSPENLDISVTIYDKTYYIPSSVNKFEAFQTFTVPDTIVHVSQDRYTDTLTRQYDEYIIDQVRSNLLKLGYSEEANPSVNSPDITVTISISTNNYLKYDWYPYWAWYFTEDTDGNVPPLETADWYYAWYPPPYGTGSSYTYEPGTLVMEMVDVSRVDPVEEKIPVIWAGLINGATGGSSSSMEERIYKGITNCFNQSDYLDKLNR